MMTESKYTAANWKCIVHHYRVLKKSYSTSKELKVYVSRTAEFCGGLVVVTGSQNENPHFAISPNETFHSANNHIVIYVGEIKLQSSVTYWEASFHIIWHQYYSTNNNTENNPGISSHDWFHTRCRHVQILHLYAHCQRLPSICS